MGSRTNLQLGLPFQAIQATESMQNAPSASLLEPLRIFAKSGREKQDICSMQSTHVLIKHPKKKSPTFRNKIPFLYMFYYFLIVSPRIFDHLSKSHIQPPPTQPNPHGSTWIHIFTNMALQEAVSTSKLRIERCAPIPTGAWHILQVESQVENGWFNRAPKMITTEPERIFMEVTFSYLFPRQKSSSHEFPQIG